MTKTEDAKNAFANHTIKYKDGQRILLRNSDNSEFWCEIIKLEHGGLYVGGDFNPVIFRYGPKSSLYALINWMGSCKDATDSYFVEKASIGRGERSLIVEWDAETARKVYANDDLCVTDWSNEHTTLTELYDQGVEPEEFRCLYAPRPCLHLAHAALQRVLELWDGREFEHGCDQCVYVGAQKFTQGLPEERIFDLYYCTPDIKNDQRISLLARYGDEPHEYLSSHPPAAYHAEYTVKPWEQVVLDAIDAARRDKQHG